MSIPETRRATRVAVSRAETHPRIALIELDTPARSMNVIDEELIDQLAEALDTLENSDDIEAAVLTSAKAGSFGAGADLGWLPTLAANPDAETFLTRTHNLMMRMARFRVPILAALDGVALGGALEIALACESIVTTDRARLGLPESSLGLIPGGGGTQLLLRWVQPATAVDLLVTGRTLTAAEGKDLGLVDDVVEPADLRAAAVTRAATLAGNAERRRVELSVTANEAVSALEAGAALTRVASPEAKEAILVVLEEGLTNGIEAGLASEREQFLKLLRNPESLALRHMFEIEKAGKKLPRATSEATAGGAATRVSKLGLVGAGQMGSGIAATAVARGLEVILRDVDTARLDEAKVRAEREVTRVGSSADIESSWQTTTEWDGFDSLDAVVEAVFELPDLKKEILAQVAAGVPEEALIATNTSAIPISSLAPAVSNAGRFMGMHFFSPVERMPLVELVPHSGTEVATIARATGLAQQLGKVPVTVADYPGFFTSRVYARWLLEALRLLLDGYGVEQIDAEAKAVGFPVGPLQAHDEATLELVLQASLTQVADRVMADRLDLDRLRTLLEALISGGVRGRRFGAGFYLYENNRRAGVNPEVAGHLTTTNAEGAAGQAGERLLLAFVTESLLCWDDATLCHPDDGDLASVLGIGFPRRLGGPFHWVDSQGPNGVRERCEALGRAFPVAETLRKLSAEGGSYSEQVRRERPGLA